MTAPRERPRASTWESLAPWDKAAEWHASAPHIADRLMELAQRQADHLMALDRREADHRQAMDLRLWRTQLIGMIGGLLCIAGLIVVAWHYADTGNIVPGLAIFGMGAGLTAGIYGSGRSISKHIGGETRER